MLSSVINRLRGKRVTDPDAHLASLPSLLSGTDELPFSSYAADWLLRHVPKGRVLDVGSGGGQHAELFARHGYRVDAVDLGRSVYFQDKTKEQSDKGQSEIAVNYIEGCFPAVDLDPGYKAIWASHVLEHQVNVNEFLISAHGLLEDQGYFVVTVPPMKPEIVGGHVSVWNAGLLLYNLIIAGFDCREAAVLRYGYNISVAVQKRAMTLPELDYDAGDIDRLAEFFPMPVNEGFDGDVVRVNWL